MADDFRFVHREESFEDLAVRELAKNRSACLCRIQFGRCTRDECRNCENNKRFQRCYKQLSDYDKQRLQSYTAELWVERSRDPMAWSSFRGNIMHIVHVFLLVIIASFIMLCPLLLLGCSKPEAKPDRAGMPVEMDEHIIPVMMQTHSQVRDLNDDKKVNCIDYACTFKLIWDRTYPDKKLWCTIVRNKNPAADFHHLFIRISDGNNMVYVEPGAHNPYRYMMEENWTEGRFNPRYNITGETQDWMEMVNASYR